MLIEHSKSFDVIVISRYNPWEGGGLENVAKQQITSLLHNNLTVAAFFRKRKNREKKGKNVVCFEVNDHLSRFSGAIADIIYAIPTYIRASKIDAKIVLDNFELPFLYAVFKENKDSLLIIKVHHGTPNYLRSYRGYGGILAKIYGLFLRPLYSFSSKKVHLNIAVSNKVKKELINDYRIPAEKIVVMPNGVDSKRFKPRDKIMARNRLNLPLNKKIILFLGGDIERKGLQKTLNVIDALKKSEENILLIVVTSKKVTADRKWIKVFNAVSHDKLPWLYNASDIFLLPSRYEGLPLSALEALASGCPAVLSHNAADEEYNGDGYLIAHNFTEYIMFCKKLLEDQAYWAKMSFLGRQLAIHKYNKLNNSSDMVRLLDTLMTNQLA